MAEPDAGVDVDCDLAHRGVLRRRANGGIHEGVDGGPEAVLYGLSEERVAELGVAYRDG